MTGGMLSTAEVAAVLGIRPATWRGYVKRGSAPAAAGRLGPRSPYWTRLQVEAYAAGRKPRKQANDVAG